MAVMPVLAASAGQTPAPGRITTVVRADEKSGRLVRSVVVEPRAVDVKVVTAVPVTPLAPQAEKAADSDAGIVAMVDGIADAEGVEGSLVHSVIRAESNYNTRAVSPKGAFGIMQLIPATARRFGVSDVFDPRENVQGGVKYLKFLLDYYQGDYARTIAAYNAGEAAVDKYNGVPPYPETRNYVYQVAKNLKSARQRKTVSPSRPAQSLKLAEATTPVETYNPIRASVGSDGRIYYRTP